MKQDNARPVTATLSRPEAVWRAIEELGPRADVTEILEYVRTKFGITPESDSPEVSSPAPVAVQDLPVLTSITPQAAPQQQPAAKQTETPAEPVRKPTSQKKPRSRNDPPE